MQTDYCIDCCGDNECQNNYMIYLQLHKNDKQINMNVCGKDICPSCYDLYESCICDMSDFIGRINISDDTYDCNNVNLQHTYENYF
jgi:hypothetical protein